MRRLLPLILLCALAAACGSGSSASDTFTLAQIGACAKVQKRLTAVKRPPVTPHASNTVRRQESKLLLQYAVKIDRALLAGVHDLRAVKAPPKLAAPQRRWLAAVNTALRARLRLDTASATQLRLASRAELKTRRAANTLAGTLGIASGCTLTY